MSIEWVSGGSVTTPRGFRAGAVASGIKAPAAEVRATSDAAPDVEERLDLGILFADRPCSVAGLFTRNRVCGAPVTLCRERVRSGVARGLIVNSGCSNVALGERGVRDAYAMAALAAAKLGVPDEQVLVGSTGVIGRALPMDKIERGVDRIELSEAGGPAFARAIMTTDTVPKARALRVRIGDRTYAVGGVAKGSGMVHPDMATVFGFLTTDANVEPAVLGQLLRKAGDLSFNMIDVDMDTSTSDTMLLFASGSAGGPPLAAGSDELLQLSEAIDALAIELARDLARDGEGARTLIEMRVDGARSLEDARRAARTVVSSPLVKTMITGRDPNLGRVMMALGRSGAELDVERISVWIGEHCAFQRGAPTALDYAAISRAMDAPEVSLRADLGLGQHSATAWGCDLTENYVRINADYTT
ncbi:MAG TPA: bifunctional glutamate N-acetyltransferase/amino-acid acetyltransferase ArgJ [Polyangiales bacterium]|nr:bifunctional glutamate N-acetyltransferase/amino-acid acetyltransferase ArgJ [Polyangiales bacterium]